MRIVTNQGILDWRNQEADIAIVFCDDLAFSKSNKSNKAVLLFREEAFPVCSPGFFQQHGPVRDVVELGKLPLLTLIAEQGQGWLDWPKYLVLRGSA
ncbi:MAG: hypothetical protein U9Q35_11725 [Pseudomonadota bacterium]|nr:hypothetical protein [Pseudomonadota bacterium]